MPISDAGFNRTLSLPGIPRGFIHAPQAIDVLAEKYFSSDLAKLYHKQKNDEIRWDEHERLERQILEDNAKTADEKLKCLMSLRSEYEQACTAHKLAADTILDDSYIKLREHLLNNDLGGYFIDRGKTVRLSNSSWFLRLEKWQFIRAGTAIFTIAEGMQRTIEPLFFHEGELKAALTGTKLDVAAPILDLTDPGAPVFAGMPVSSPEPERPSAQSPDTRGAPPKYDSEGFLLEAFRILWDDHVPPRQAELRRRATEAYRRKGLKGGQPSDDWAKRKVRKLWHELGLGSMGD